MYTQTTENIIEWEALLPTVDCKELLTFINDI